MQTERKLTNVCHLTINPFVELQLNYWPSVQHLHRQTGDLSGAAIAGGLLITLSRFPCSVFPRRADYMAHRSRQVLPSPSRCECAIGADLMADQKIRFLRQTWPPLIRIDLHPKNASEARPISGKFHRNSPPYLIVRYFSG